jgi:hypothetical protein
VTVTGNRSRLDCDLCSGMTVGSLLDREDRSYTRLKPSHIVAADRRATSLLTVRSLLVHLVDMVLADQCRLHHEAEDRADGMQAFRRLPPVVDSSGAWPGALSLDAPATTPENGPLGQERLAADHAARDTHRRCSCPRPRRLSRLSRSKSANFAPLGGWDLKSNEFSSRLPWLLLERVMMLGAGADSIRGSCHPGTLTAGLRRRRVVTGNSPSCGSAPTSRESAPATGFGARTR